MNTFTTFLRAQLLVVFLLAIDFAAQAQTRTQNQEINPQMEQRLDERLEWIKTHYPERFAMMDKHELQMFREQEMQMMQYEYQISGAFNPSQGLPDLLSGLEPELNEPGIHEPVKGVSDNSRVSVSDSLALVALYNATGGINWTNKTNWLTRKVNTWYGITVTSGYITRISLPENRLTGAIPAEIGNFIFLNKLNLSGNEINNNIPPEIGNLTSLVSLYLNNNQLTGSIPPEIGNLTNLYTLNVYGNQLTGSIPLEIGNLTNLYTLIFTINQLTGSIPPEIGNLTNLNSVYLSSNQLTGSIPPEIGNLTNLNTLSLSNNQITGNIPPEIGNLANLNVLYLSSNQITGNIPPEIRNLANLNVLYLSSNQLTGSIPIEIFNLANLFALSLSNNQLSGSIPPEIGNLKNMVYLYLDNNQLTGSIPPEIGNLTNLFYLYLDNNQITGSIPPEIGNLTNLYTLYLNSNQITGSIPPEIGNLTKLYTLNLNSNQLTDSIPPEIGNMISLSFLDFSSNQLTGTIPDSFRSIDNLINFDIRENALNSMIPLSMVLNKGLTTLTLDSNNFTKSDCGIIQYISTQLPSCIVTHSPQNTGFDFGVSCLNLPPPSNIQAVNAGNGAIEVTWTAPEQSGLLGYHLYRNDYNRINSDLITQPMFTDIFEGDFVRYHVIAEYEEGTSMPCSMSTDLILNQDIYDALAAIYNSTSGSSWTHNSNWLTGSISTWYGLTATDGKITQLQLDDNNLIGTIPAEIGNLSDLDYLSFYHNQLTGSIPAEIGNLTSLVSLYLNYNQLTGSIPPQIGNLTNLNTLSLSFNKITGNIPSEIGNLTNLNSLGLSSNQITGNIPSEIGNLTNLIKLSLYNNQITGKIPAEFENLTGLKSLWLQNNQLTGSIPSEIGNLTNLETLYLDFNQLTGSIPPEIGNMTNLSELKLNSNQLTGSIPPEIGNLLKLYSLNLNYNQLTGILPMEFGNLSKLHAVWLDNNQLTGDIPTSIGKLTSLSSLQLDHNQLTGNIPTSIGTLTSLESLNLSYNQLTGSIPIEICNISNLLYFYFHSNYFDLGSCPAIACLWNKGVTMNGTQLNGYDLLTDCDFLVFVYLVKDSDYLCSDGSSYYVEDVFAGNYSTVAWSTSGSGYFENGNTLHPTYFPSFNDYQHGSITIDVVVSGYMENSNDSMTLFFGLPPDVYVGTDTTIYIGNQYAFTNTNVSNFDTFEWSTTGDGVFDNNGSLNPTYTPGMTDIATGQAALCLKVNTQFCENVTDCMILSIINEGVPDFSINTAGITQQLQSGQTNTQNLEISNMGDGDLYWSLEIIDEMNKRENAKLHLDGKTNSLENMKYHGVYDGQSDETTDDYLKLQERMMSDGLIDVESMSEEKAPETYPGPLQYSDLNYNLQFEYPIDGVTYPGQAGIETDGSYIYTTDWQAADAGKFYAYSLNGTFLGQIIVPGLTTIGGGIRDMAYDGTYFYGSPANTTTYQFTLSGATLTGSLIGSWVAPTATRAIAYDFVADGFYANNWSTTIYLYSRSGANLGSMPTVGNESYYGFAWDPQGPYLWGYSQKVGTSQNMLYKLATPGGAVLESFDVLTVLTFAVYGDIAGGAFFKADLIQGTYTLGGLVQNKCMWGLEIGTTGSTPTVDVGVTAFVSPVSGPNLGNETVTITVKNYSANPIGDIPVSYTLNGGAALNSVLAGPIASGATADFTFPGTVDLSNPNQTYVFVGCTALTGDVNAGNNCKTQNVTHLIPIVDVGVTAFVSLVSGPNLGNETVTITVKNYSENPVGDIPVSYTLNGSAAVNGVIAGPLASGATIDFSFPGTVDLSNPGQTYVFVGCTALTGDVNPGNNCKTQNVTHLIHTYCDASTTTEDEYIANVLLGNINHSSGWQQGTANYSSLVTIIEPGMAEEIMITNGLPNTADLVYCWVDWDRDYEFNTSQEQVILNNVNGTGETFDGQIIVPEGIAVGNYQIRIRMTRSSIPDPCGSAMYGEIEDYTITVGSVAPLTFYPPTNPSVVFVSPNKTLVSWDPPIEPGEWIFFDDGINADGLGLAGGGSFFVAAHWDPGLLEAFDDYYLTKVSIFPTSTMNATFNLMIWSGSTGCDLIVNQPLSGLIMNEWNTIVLNSSIRIDASNHLWVGYEVFHLNWDKPVGMDNGPAIAGYGDMVSFDGCTWESMATAYSINYNFNIRAFVSFETKDSGPHLLPKPLLNNKNHVKKTFVYSTTGSNKQKNVFGTILTGYEIYRDGVLVGSTDKTITSYQDTNLEPGSYSYTLKAVYNEGLSEATEPLWVTVPTISDIGIQYFVSPLSGRYLGNEIVTVRAKNLGNIPLSDIPIYYRLDGGAEVIETITSIISVGEAFYFTFPQTVDLGIPGQTYLLEACTSLPGDQNPENDCLASQVTNIIPDYCVASTTVEDEYIANVVFGDIDKSSGWQGGIADYRTIINTMNPGDTEEIIITNGYAWADDKVTCWIDWDKDFEFGTGNEQFILTNIGGTGQIFSGSITVPDGTPNGNYRLRIRMTYSTAPTACGTKPYGEVEDYTIAVGVKWLHADIVTGFLAPDVSTLINLTFDATDLTPDVYTANINITSNDPDTPILEIPVQLTVQTSETQTINLNQGWSGISSYLQPSPDDVESIFQPIISDLIILQNETGMYWPGENVNTIGTWETHEGYKIKVANAVDLTITGTRENNKTMQLSEGWNLFPVISECEVEVASLFAGTDLVIVKEVAGWNIYWPEFGINSLGFMEPGKAYFALMGSDGTIAFPDCTSKSVTVKGNSSRNLLTPQALKEVSPSSWQGLVQTAITHTVGIPASASKSLASGDVIGAFNESGNCCGISLWQDESTSLTLFGNDPTTAIKDGFDENEPLLFRIYRQGSNEEFALEPTFDKSMPNPELVFVGNGLSSFSEIRLLSSGISNTDYQTSVSIIPNPAKDEFRILVEDTEFTEGSLTLLSMDARIVKTIKLVKNYEVIDIVDLKSGVYVLQIVYGSKTINKRLVKH